MLFRSQKRTWLNKYRFTLTFENSSTEGYATEKIMDAFLGRTVPLYWGDLRLKREGFNPGAFLNYFETPGDDRFIARIKEVDETKQAYLDMLSTPVFATVPDLLYSDNMIALYTKMIEG